MTTKQGAGLRAVAATGPRGRAAADGIRMESAMRPFTTSAPLFRRLTWLDHSVSSLVSAKPALGCDGIRPGFGRTRARALRRHWIPRPPGWSGHRADKMSLGPRGGVLGLLRLVLPAPRVPSGRVGLSPPCRRLPPSEPQHCRGGQIAAACSCDLSSVRRLSRSSISCRRESPVPPRRPRFGLSVQTISSAI